MSDQHGEIPNFDDVQAVVSKSAVLGIIAMFVLALFAAVCLGAPAPLPRPARPIAAAEVAGTWHYIWGTTGTLYLNPDGKAVECWTGEVYLGTWRLDGNGLFITTRSRCGATYIWGIVYLKRKDGRLTGDKYDMVRRAP